MSERCPVYPQKQTSVHVANGLPPRAYPRPVFRNEKGKITGYWRLLTDDDPSNIDHPIYDQAWNELLRGIAKSIAERGFEAEIAAKRASEKGGTE